MFKPYLALLVLPEGLPLALTPSVVEGVFILVAPLLFPYLV